jgi:hypothetical protein
MGGQQRRRPAKQATDSAYGALLTSRLGSTAARLMLGLVCQAIYAFSRVSVAAAPIHEDLGIVSYLPPNLILRMRSGTLVKY